jgi:multidrug transporter EmrE-like cation transporter
MPILSPAFLVVVGVLATAVAQVLLKKAAAFDVRTSSWILWMGLSAATYTLSFVAYSRILKYYALNKIYPAMTVAQIVLITLYGLWLGEAIGGRQALGLLLGAVAIYLILS